MNDLIIMFPNLEFVYLLYPYDDVQPLLEFVDRLPRLKRFHLINNDYMDTEHGMSFLAHFNKRKIQFLIEFDFWLSRKRLEFDHILIDLF